MVTSRRHVPRESWRIRIVPGRKGGGKICITRAEENRDAGGKGEKARREATTWSDYFGLAAKATGANDTARIGDAAWRAGQSRSRDQAVVRAKSLSERRDDEERSSSRFVLVQNEFVL